MPKLKTKRAAAKRYHVTRSGKVKVSHAGRRHILTTKNRKLKRHKRSALILNATDSANARKLLPYA